MMELNLQLFGGRGAGSGIENTRDWLANEGGTTKGTAQPIDISQYEGWTLEQTEGRLRSLKHEELFVFDKNNQIVEAYEGGRNSVSFPVYLLNQEGITVTHGHPKGSEDFGGTFSWADINNMLNSKWAEHRATASGQGEMNYIMRRTANADPQGLRNKINQDFQRIDAKWRRVYRDAYNNAVNSGKTKAQANHIARQKGVGVLNAYYKRTFPAFGFEYVTRKETYKYNR